MRPSAIVLASGIFILACNQSDNKEIGEYDPSATTAATPDTSRTSLSTSTGSPTTTAVAGQTTPTPTADSSGQSPTTSVEKTTLGNFWVLESVDGKALKSDEFPNGTPYFELSTKKGKVSGHAGCNSMNGSIKVTGQFIEFGELTTTKATCSAQQFENSYINALSGHKVGYKIEGTKLYLTAEPNRAFVYRKIQQ